MKLGVVVSTNDPEVAFNAMRLANFATNEGDEVAVFLMNAGVELDQIEDTKFNIRGQTEVFMAAGGRIMACGTCLKLRNSEGSEICPMSTMNDLYHLLLDSYRVISF